MFAVAARIPVHTILAFFKGRAIQDVACKGLSRRIFKNHHSNITMLESVSDLIKQPYEEAKKELKCIITDIVSAGETSTEKKIRMLMYVAEFSSDDEPVTNKDILGAIGISEEDVRQRNGLKISLSKTQKTLQGYIAVSSTVPRQYHMREDVLSAYEAEHGICLRTDFLEILNGLLESQKPLNP